MRHEGAGFWRIIAGLALFGIAFGYLEASVVVYLRSIYTPLRSQLHPLVSGNEIFPLISFDQLRAFGPEHVVRLRIELGREFSTLAMLAAVAIVAARNFRQWIAAFIICFGVWDITFYAFLKLLVGWPASLFTWDILFLLPVPWTGPVLAPILVSISIVAAGVLVLWREDQGEPYVISPLRWLFIVAGGVIVLISFMIDFRHVASGGLPHPFHWALFLTGEAIGIIAFAIGIHRSSFATRSNPPSQLLQASESEAQSR